MHGEHLYVSVAVLIEALRVVLVCQYHHHYMIIFIVVHSTR